MDIVSIFLVVLVAFFVLGYVVRPRTKRAMNFEWALQTDLPEDELEALIRKHLRGYWPIGRVRGSLREGQLTRRIWRFAVNLSSEATVVIDCDKREPDGSRTVKGSMDNCHVETWAGMTHPTLSAPLAARRRLVAVLRALQAPSPPAGTIPPPTAAAPQATSDAGPADWSDLSR